MQAYIEDCRNPTPSKAQEQKDALNKPLKARNPDLYYGNLHMECYYFSQQCEDHLEIAGAKSHKRIPFVAFFLKDKIFFY